MSYHLSNNIEEQIHKGLEIHQLTAMASDHLAKNALALSDFYIQNPKSQTPWEKPWAQTAYLSYFHPLNYLRSKRVFDHGDRLGFFSGLQHIVDFGSGLGAGSLPILEKKNILSIQFIESSRDAQKLHHKIYSNGARPEWSLHPDFRTQREKALAVVSYSLTEISEIAKELLECEALMILEPSTRDDGRKLLQLRENLQDLGYSIWAPCTHQMRCPLLHESKNDWCHDRLHIQKPDWLKNMENRMPIKNQTLTVSYLLARKTPPPPSPASGRLTGDQLNEKGKSKQLFCRSPKREFLVWMHKELEAPELPRGDLIQISGEPPLEKSNELRVTKQTHIVIP